MRQRRIERKIRDGLRRREVELAEKCRMSRACCQSAYIIWYLCGRPDGDSRDEIERMLSADETIHREYHAVMMAGFRL